MREPMSELSVYYDGACPLCRAEIAHYRRCRGAEALSFVDVSTTAPSEGLSCRQALARFHVRETPEPAPASVLGLIVQHVAALAERGEVDGSKDRGLDGLDHAPVVMSVRSA